jgi:hypothetical protein
VTPSLAWPDIGHLKMILWDFDKLQIGNLDQAATRQLTNAESARLGLSIPDPPRFAHEVRRLSHGNPGLIVELCAQASKGRYVFGHHLSTQLLNLDRRIGKLDLP